MVQERFDLFSHRNVAQSRDAWAKPGRTASSASAVHCEVAGGATHRRLFVWRDLVQHRSSAFSRPGCGPACSALKRADGSGATGGPEGGGGGSIANRRRSTTKLDDNFLKLAIFPLSRSRSLRAALRFDWYQTETSLHRLRNLQDFGTAEISRNQARICFASWRTFWY